jgi:hypothetical protein
VCRRGSDAIRIVVAGELPQVERNAMLHLFSAAPEQVQYGAEHHQLQSVDTSSIVNQLFGEYRQEGLTMPYTMEDFRRDIARQHVRELTLEERLAGLSASQIEAYLRRIRKKPSFSPKKKPKPKR